MQQERIIAHFDLDSFFVSVECLLDPSLKGKPVIVGGGDRGVVAACSYEARKYGIHSAMPSARAKQLCPQAIFVKGTRGEYSRYSRWVTDIIASKAPLFEKASIDEFYIDLSGMQRFFDPLQWTIDLRMEIMIDTGLPISFGLSVNKMMAKMATNLAKPNGFLQIPPGKEKEFLAPLPVESIPGVGEHTKELLHASGIFKIRDIYNKGKDTLEEKLGKWGPDLWLKSQGIHLGEVSSYHESKSISTEHTFDENVTDVNFLLQTLTGQTEKVCYQLRREAFVTGCVAVKIRYADFETTSRQQTIDFTTADDEIIPVIKNLFHKLYRKGNAVRLIGVRLSELTHDAVQASLFTDHEKKAGLYKAIDSMRDRFGRTIVKRASSD